MESVDGRSLSADALHERQPEFARNRACVHALL